MYIALIHAATAPRPTSNLTHVRPSLVATHNGFETCRTGHRSLRGLLAVPCSHDYHGRTARVLQSSHPKSVRHRRLLRRARLGKSSSYQALLPMRNADMRKILFVLHAAFAITGVHHGTGQHAWDIQPPSELPIGLKVSCLIKSIR